MASKFEVVFRGTFGDQNTVVGTYSTIKRARTAAEKKNQAHGSYAHTVREVKS